jgi:hypothetical protein
MPNGFDQEVYVMAVTRWHSIFGGVMVAREIGLFFDTPYVWGFAVANIARHVLIPALKGAHFALVEALGVPVNDGGDPVLWH